MKTARKVSILVAVGLIVVGLAVSLAAFAVMGADVEALNTMTFVEKTYTVEEPFDSLYIEGAECDIRFAPSASEACRVECTEGETIHHTVEVEDGTLTIRRVDDRRWYEHLGVYWGSMKITVYLPETAYDTLYVRTASGDIQIGDTYSFNEAEVYDTSGDVHFSAAVHNTLSVKTVSGDLTVRNVKADRLTAQSTSGEVNLSAVETATQLHVSSTSGDITLTDVTCGGPLLSDNTSGDTVFDRVNAGSMESASVSGDIRLSECDAATLRLKTSSGDVRGSLLSHKIFATETSSGSIQVPPSTAGGLCEIKTVSGDIKISVA